MEPMGTERIRRLRKWATSAAEFEMVDPNYGTEGPKYMHLTYFLP